MQRQRVPPRAWLAVALPAVVAGAVALPRAGEGPVPVSFAADVQPIFDRKCTTCHPVSYPYLDLRRGRSYSQLVRVSARTAPAFERVLPGRPELSYLLTHPPDPSLRDLLADGERDVITAWIRQGAAND